MVFAGVFPTDSADYEALRDALSKLHMNDSSFQFEPDTSEALGFGFRCGFLGLLHMEIIQERLEREYNLDLITTAPSVVYRAFKKDGEMVLVDNPSKMPAVGDLDRIEEPIMKVTVHTPAEYVGAVVALVRGPPGLPAGHPFRDQDPRRRQLRATARGGHSGLPRPAQERLSRLRQHGLRAGRLSRRRPGETRHAAQRRAAGRADPSSSTGRRRIRGAGRWPRSSRSSSPGSSTRWQFKPPSAPRSSVAKPYGPCART